MAKEIDLKKIQKEFEKGTLDKQIEAYQAMGVWLHEKIANQQKELQLQSEKLNKSK